MFGLMMVVVVFLLQSARDRLHGNTENAPFYEHLLENLQEAIEDMKVLPSVILCDATLIHR